MIYILKLILLIALFSVAYQDFRERRVDFLLFVLVGLVLGYIHFLKATPIVFITTVAINISFVLLLLLILNVYTRLKMKKKLRETFGLGDALFFIGFALGFPTATFLILFCFSLFFSMLLFLVLKKKLKVKTVPLAGFQAFFLTIVLVGNTFFQFVTLYTV